ncbi:UV-endonuclease UvdE [Coniophora puteana RWD-64-598 SS2]|uniref:UV-endonuclease UvdE n=1 Tax=Coniophora puteana (strain RWD-64-598) TaxID=741705 RepID=A0A5M3MVN9_CONPW|nr:UV-endonuclease UvdE [Coniophora puteana RWD-64-598 SS2]EIW83196.1 UV-endonuclease UvdE [Coniophora puteana RWD-64-598 SS2]
MPRSSRPVVVNSQPLPTRSSRRTLTTTPVDTIVSAEPNPDVVAAIPSQKRGRAKKTPAALKAKEDLEDGADAYLTPLESEVDDELILKKPHRKAAKKAANEVVETAQVGQEPVTATKRKRKAGKVEKAVAVVAEEAAQVTSKMRKKKLEEEKPEALSDQDVEVHSPKKRSRKRKASAPEDSVIEGEEVAPKKKRKPRAPKPEPVYVIPDVEKKESTFKGRLGYACLNTVLRNKKPASEAIFCSRTCRIESIKKNGMEWVKELGLQNMRDMLAIIEWNEQNNIRFMRLSSEMFPFASHKIYGYSLEYAAPICAEVGALARKYGHRLTTHPGQFTQLGSPRDEVVRASIRELEYHTQMLGLIGMGPDSVMIIHGGGVYGDKEPTLQRLHKNISELPSAVRARLVLENDELCYNAADLLPICKSLQVPLVFDYHHDQLYPSPDLPPAEIIKQANEIWVARGIKPKQHLSEPRNGAETIMERRAHADRCQNLPVDLPDDMDLMIEAKDKEQAVLHLYRIYSLQPVIHASLRPPAEKETKETKGRKSPRKAKAKKLTSDDELTQEELEAEDQALETGIGIEGGEGGAYVAGDIIEVDNSCLADGDLPGTGRRSRRRSGRTKHPAAG